MTHAEIVAALGIDALHSATGVELIGIKRWQQRDSIPGCWWVRVVALAREQRVAGVTYQTLAEGVAK